MTPVISSICKPAERQFTIGPSAHNAPLSDILTGRLGAEAVTLEELTPEWLRPFRSITLCACGTSYHAALVGSYLLERLARVPAKVEIASEFRYREPVLDPDGLFLVISQSGETADTPLM